MSTGKVLLGVLAGAAAGALLGILFAPDKGSETRKKLVKKSGDLTDSLQEKYDELMNGMTEKAEDAKSYVQNGKAKANEFKKDVKNSLG